MVARLLLKRGAEVNMQGMHKETPLHDAARNGHFQVCVITNDPDVVEKIQRIPNQNRAFVTNGTLVVF